MNRKISFLFKFFLIYLSLNFIIAYSEFGILQNSIAGFEAGLFGAESKDNLILFDEGTFLISSSCTGLVSAAVLAAVVFSLKKPDLKLKIISVTTGTIFLLLLNLLRVYFVLWSGINYGIQTAELVHMASWLLMSAVILAIWYLSMRKFSGIKNLEELL